MIFKKILFFPGIFFAVFLFLPLSVHAKGLTLDGAIGHWTFDEGKGKTLKDDVKNFDGKIEGAKWAKGLSGKEDDFALQFDGSDTVTIESATKSFNDLEEISISAWIKPKPGSESEEYPFVSKRRKKGPATGWELQREYSATGNRIMLKAPGEPVSVSQPNKVQDDAWQHVVVTYKNPEKGEDAPREDFVPFARVYLNGQDVTDQESAGVNSLHLFDDNAPPLVFGATSVIKEGFKRPEYFGALDEVTIYKRILSAGEVDEIYKNSYLEEKIEELPVESEPESKPEPVTEITPAPSQSPSVSPTRAAANEIPPVLPKTGQGQMFLYGISFFAPYFIRRRKI